MNRHRTPRRSSVAAAARTSPCITAGRLTSTCSTSGFVAVASSRSKVPTTGRSTPAPAAAAEAPGSRHPSTRGAGSTSRSVCTICRTVRAVPTSRVRGPAAR